ncbi:DUF4489 domain-containing protein [Vallitalea okinawensis]|uniref:DUF4489 domain-containing protein n=1 Tax=Vallitalea okinawensis TaxID=2078660 RepID=UPI000CFE112C|nr:DUF4489 domain-containing protein [Vallitalea okinawensis]
MSNLIKKASSQPTLLFCGQGGNGAFVNPDDPSVIIGRVFVDATNINRPTVSLAFSSIVSFLATEDGLAPNADGAEARLTFGLFKACNEKPPELLNNWTYEVFRIEDAFEGTRFIKTFSFNFCDVSSCSECCEYFVEISLENLLTANIVVNNVHMTALVQ